MEKTTSQWIEACRRGNRSAQMSLYNQYARLLYRACYRIVGKAEEAEEAMQDSFLKIFTRLDQFHDGQCFEAWIHRIAVHTAIDYVRRQMPEMEELSDKHTPQEEEETLDEEKIAYSVQQIKKAALELPPGYRVILSLHLFEGYDMEEIAGILDLKPSSVRSQYLRGKRKLIEKINKTV